jgi:hypothetical protein
MRAAAHIAILFSICFSLQKLFSYSEQWYRLTKPYLLPARSTVRFLNYFAVQELRTVYQFSRQWITPAFNAPDDQYSASSFRG